MSALLRLWTIVPVTELIVLEAIRGCQQYGLNLWDAQIWAAARLNQVRVLLSEDFQDGIVLEGVRVQPWPADDAPIMKNSFYADGIVTILMLDGTLKPVE